MSHYAYQVFPWINIPKAVTTSGFLTNKRFGEFRKAWGEVLGGTDEQLIEALSALNIVSAANNKLTEEDVRAFYQTLIDAGEVEGALSSPILPSDTRLTYFRNGVKYAKG